MNTEREDVTAAHCKNTIIRESDSGFFFGDMKTSNEQMKDIICCMFINVRSALSASYK